MRIEPIRKSKHKIGARLLCTYHLSRVEFRSLRRLWTIVGRLQNIADAPSNGPKWVSHRHGSECIGHANGLLRFSAAARDSDQ